VASDRKGVTPLPVRTSWVPIHKPPAPEGSSSIEDAAAQLEDLALKLGKVKALLGLQPFQPTGYFPYKLALKNLDTGELVKQGTIREGEHYRFALYADKEELKPGKNELKRDPDRRWIYIFSALQNGATEVKYPSVAQGSVENHLPASFPAEGEILVGKRFHVIPPFGVETYMLLASDDPIDDPFVFQQEGVVDLDLKSRGRGGPPPNPLALLLRQAMGRTRGLAEETDAAPSNWSVAPPLTVRSVPSGGGKNVVQSSK
jgi:hypothetical protein